MLRPAAHATTPQRRREAPVKHATPAALAHITELLERVRAVDGVKEKSPGVFYRKSRAFLHFHEDPAGIFADLRTGEEFERYPVNDRSEREALLTLIEAACSE